MMRALCVAVVSLALGGCATDVDDPVQQIPDPANAKDPPAQTLSGSLPTKIQDPYFREIQSEVRRSNPPDLGNQPEFISPGH